MVTTPAAAQLTKRYFTVADFERMIEAGIFGEDERVELIDGEDVFLLVEVADSSLRDDREGKIPVYARAAIPETWLVNLIDNVVLVFREPSPEGYRLVRTARRGETIAPLAFPDWAIPVDEVLPAR